MKKLEYLNIRKLVVARNARLEVVRVNAIAIAITLS
jgi:hypothetical protein